MDDVTIEVEFQAVFHLHLDCRHNKSNAKTLGTGYQKIFTLIAHSIVLIWNENMDWKF